MKLVHNVGTALEVEWAAVIFLYKSILLSLELPPVHYLFPIISTPLDPDLDPLNVLIRPDYLILFLLVPLFRPRDFISPIYLFFFIWIILEVLEFLLDLLIFFLIIVIISIVIFIIVFIVVLLELLKQLDVFCCWIAIEGLAAIVDYVDLPQGVNEVVVMEGPMGVEDEVHDLGVWAIVPLNGLVDEATTVDKDQTSHLRKL